MILDILLRYLVVFNDCNELQVADSLQCNKLVDHTYRLCSQLMQLFMNGRCYLVFFEAEGKTLAKPYQIA
jgi:hypothetical protein